MDLFDVFELDNKKEVKRKHEDNTGNEEDVDPNLIDELISNVKRQKGNENVLNPTTVEALTKQPDQDEEVLDEDLGHFSARVVIQELETQGSCMHEVVIPVDLEFVPLRDNRDNPNYKPAKEYKFILDSFQKEAILCIENNQSVLGKLSSNFMLKCFKILISNSFCSYFGWKNRSC